MSFTFLFVDFQHIEADRPDLYDIKNASDGLIIDASQKLTSAAAKCSASLPTTIVPLDQIPHQQDFALLVNHHRGYNLTMFVPPGDFSYNLEGQCVDSDGIVTPYAVPLPVTFPVGGTSGAIARGLLPPDIAVDVIKFDKTTTIPNGATTQTITRRADLHSAGAP
jgi:hypothetical protein